MTDRSTAAAVDRLDRTLRWTVLAALLLGLVALLGDVLLLIFAALLFATVLRGAALRIGGWLGIAPGWALLGVILLLVAIPAVFVWFRGPATLDQFEGLRQQLVEQFGMLRDAVRGTSLGRAALDRIGRYLSGAGGTIAGTMAGVATSTLGALGSLLLILVTGLYFAGGPMLYTDGAVRLLPPSRRRAGRAVLLQVGHTLRWWFAGQLVDMVVVALLSYIGLRLLGMPLALSLALLAGLLNFVPFIGALAGAAPAVLIAFGQGWTQALYVAGLYFAVQSFEGYVTAPLIQKRTVSLPPALTILSQTVLGTLFGPMGLILATPLFAAGMVVTRMVYIERILEADDDQSGAAK